MIKVSIYFKDRVILFTIYKKDSKCIKKNQHN